MTGPGIALNDLKKVRKYGFYLTPLIYLYLFSVNGTHLILAVASTISATILEMSKMLGIFNIKMRQKKESKEVDEALRDEYHRIYDLGSYTTSELAITAVASITMIITVVWSFVSLFPLVSENTTAMTLFFLQIHVVTFYVAFGVLHKDLKQAMNLNQENE